MKKIFLILFVLIGISYASAQEATAYTQYRFIVDEYGEMSPKTLKSAECYARIEFYFENDNIKVFTKSYGNTSIDFDDGEIIPITDSYQFSNIVKFYKNGVMVALAGFDSSDNMTTFMIIRGNKKIVYAKDE